MHHTHATIVINAPIGKVWPLIGDVTAIERWHPSVAKADLLSSSPTGPSAARRCNFYDGTSVREDVIELEEGSRVRLTLSEFSVPMKRLDAETTLKALPDGQTEATFALHYQVKWGVFGKLMGATIMKRELTKMAARILSGLRHHVETGETVGKGFVARAA